MSAGTSRPCQCTMLSAGRAFSKWIRMRSPRCKRITGPSQLSGRWVTRSGSPERTRPRYAQTSVCRPGKTDTLRGAARRTISRAGSPCGSAAARARKGSRDHARTPAPAVPAICKNGLRLIMASSFRWGPRGPRPEYPVAEMNKDALSKSKCRAARFHQPIFFLWVKTIRLCVFQNRNRVESTHSRFRPAADGGALRAGIEGDCIFIIE